jgi:hypothetical protein
MWRPLRLPAATACLLAAVLYLAAWSTAAQAAPRCVVHGASVGGVRTSRVVALTAGMVVYRTRSADEGKELHDLWACGRRSDRFVLVGREELQPGYEEGALSGIHVAGTWLIVTQETGLTAISECEKYEYQDPGGCPSPVESLLVVNAASGLQGSVSAGALPGAGQGALLSTALLSSDGAMAWWTQQKEAASSLYGCLATATKRKLVCRPRLVAQGSIPEASVRLSGRTLSWSAAGQQQSSVL